MSSNSLSNRIIVVTGASRGIGQAAALACAKRGATIVAMARTVSGLETLDDQIKETAGQSVLIPADLSNEEMLSRLPAALTQRFGRVDGLILNAGSLGPLTPTVDILGKEWHETFTVNLHANLALIQLLHPLLSESDAGRIAAVSSRAARVFKPFWGPYAASKAALEALIQTYAAEQSEGTIKANLLDPGPTATAMRKEAMPGEDPATIHPPNLIGERLADMVEPTYTDNGDLVTIPRPNGK
ncbi:MAG: SDR family NAD(P)-dependent oxidoreductase [Parvularculaceae bacterium]|nr:SDR family NAD(P)-dependent oxidoreductase [Parvularculaceae bacterium]